jgi:hypothetical protein
VRPLTKNYSGIQGILNSLVRVKNEINQATDNHAEAVGLISWLHSFEFILLTTGTRFFSVLKIVIKFFRAKNFP